LSNLPVAVVGSASTNSNTSGTHHEAIRCARWAARSEAVTAEPARRTTSAAGRSVHTGCATAITIACATSGWSMRWFSTSIELIHSPPDLMRSLVRSTRRRYPYSSIVAMSPVRSQPSRKFASLLSPSGR
jgi:hypothetical protein